MKTKILILLSGLCLSIITSQAQITTAFKPLKQFDKDTLAFLNANFGITNSSFYTEGRNLKIFMEDINQELPIKAFRTIKTASPGGIFIIDFYYYSIEEIKARTQKNVKVPSIQFVFYPISSDQPLYQEIQNMGIDVSGKLISWDKKYLEVLNKLETDYFVLNEYYEL